MFYIDKNIIIINMQEQNNQTKGELVVEKDQMKCVKVVGPKTIKVCTESIPKPNSGEVLIKVMAAPINPSDIQLYNGNYGHQKKFPTIWGFQGSGIVIENGGGFMGWSMVGKKVAFAVDKQGVGSYAQYAVAKVDQCLPLTSNTSFQEGSMSLVNPLTAMAMLQILKSKKQTSCLLTAAASALCRMMNRTFPSQGIEIINVVRRDQQVQVLKKEGAKYILNSSDENFQEKLKQLTEKLNTRTCFEAIGGSMTGLILKNMPKHSTVTVYGCLSHENVQDIDVMDLLVNNKTVNSFLLPNWLHTKSQMKLLPMFYKVRNSMTGGTKSHIAKQFELDQAQQALSHYMKNMTDGKVLFKPWKQEK